MEADAGVVSSCLLCGAHGRADGSCPSCLVAMPRAVCARCNTANGPMANVCRACAAPLADPAPQSACPRCAGQLEDVMLEGGYRDGVGAPLVVRVCRSCHGCLLGPRAWCMLRRKPELATALTARLAGAPPPGAAVIPLLKCPICRLEMDRGRFAATSTTVIDACSRGHGIWLDCGELGPVLDYAAHRDAIGVDAARVESENRERNATGWDPARARLESEVLRLQANEAKRQWDAKRSGLTALGVIVALRLVWSLFGYYEARRHASAAVPVTTVTVEQTTKNLAP